MNLTLLSVSAAAAPLSRRGRLSSQSLSGAPAELAPAAMAARCDFAAALGRDEVQILYFGAEFLTFTLCIYRQVSVLYFTHLENKPLVVIAEGGAI